jgi:hypothetical protein
MPAGMCRPYLSRRKGKKYNSGAGNNKMPQYTSMVLSELDKTIFALSGFIRLYFKLSIAKIVHP